MTHEVFNESLFDFYQAVTLAVEKIYAPLLRTKHLSIVQLRLLMTVRMNKEVTVGQLSDLTGMNSGNCSSMCKKLESSGLLIRSRDRADERIVRICLSQTGSEIIDSLIEQSASIQDRLQAEIREEDARIISESAGIIRTYIDKLT